LLGWHFQPEAWHCWPSTAAQSALRTPAQRGHHAVATRVAARWRGRRDFIGGQGVARQVGTPRGSDGGYAEQGGAVAFSPEMAGGGGAEKMAQ
jgi:hypothetical protein